jgi:hypothetical protein
MSARVPKRRASGPGVTQSDERQFVPVFDADFIE